jgi:6-phosphogluconolactonase
VAIYRIDLATGVLTPNDPPTMALPKGAGPRHLAFHPSERFAYVINELGSTLTSFSYDPARGVLSGPSTLSMLPVGFAGKNSGAQILVEPKGGYLYGSNRGHDSLAIFRLDAQTGVPALAAHETAGGEIRTPRNFTIDPTGTLALVASQGADLVTVFRLDPVSGSLVRLSSVPVGKGPTFVGVMPAP